MYLVLCLTGCMRVWFVAAVLALVVVGFVGSGLRVHGLEGPQLYVYSDRGVYPPGSSAIFRVLAIGADGGPAAGVSVLATVYDPGSAVVGQFEGVTDGGGWFVFSVVLGVEGFYMVSVQDVGGEYAGSDVSVLVCSDCPYEVSTTTVTSTSTVTTSVGTVTSTVSTTVTSPVFTTVVSRLTTTAYTTVGTTVYETTAYVGTVTFTVVSTSTVRSVEVVRSTLTATVFRTGTVTVFNTVSFTETVWESIVTTLVSTVVSTVAGFSDGLLTFAVIVVVALLVFAAVLYVVRRRSA